MCKEHARNTRMNLVMYVILLISCWAAGHRTFVGFDHTWGEMSSSDSVYRCSMAICHARKLLISTINHGSMANIIENSD